MLTHLSPAPLTKFSEDKLNLEPFADDLTNIVMSQLPHPVNKCSKVIALDSGWGTGKTSFINMWTDKLETKFSQDFICLTYNAWENDDSSDALIPLICNFQQQIDEKKTPEGKKLNLADDIKKIIATFGPPIASEAIGIASQYLIGINLGNLARAGCKSLAECKDDNYPNKIFETYMDRQKNKDLFKKFADKVRGEHKYLIICIDELDRCRPTFAIETLEVVKHFFGISNVVFVFSLDMTQLQKSIKTIYGDIDSLGYFQKFFDYRISLPKQGLESFLKDRLEKLDTPRTDYEKEQRKCEITWLSDIARQHSISLRELNNICIVYTKFKFYVRNKFDWTIRDRNKHNYDDRFSFKENIYGQWYYFQTYLTFIAMKYSRPDEYWSFIQNGTNFDDLEKNKSEKLWYMIFGSKKQLTSSKEGKDFKFLSSYTKDTASQTPRSILLEQKTGVTVAKTGYRLFVGSEINMTEYRDLQLPAFIDTIIEESLVKKCGE